MKSILTTIALSLALLFASSTAASALTLTNRSLDVAGKLEVKQASDLAQKMLKLAGASDDPIFLRITATAGSAQAVAILADTIRSIESPVVGIVMTQVHGVGAALAPFTDRVLIYPSAGLVFTELAYEGVHKPKTPGEPAASDAAKGDAAKPKKAKVPDKTTLRLQSARSAFLDRFYARLAKRVGMGAETLQAAIADGGLIVTASEAVDRKIAHGLVDALTYVQLPTDKTEIKVITTKKDIRVLTEEPPKIQ